MTEGERKRKIIFDAYSHNLNFLIEIGVISNLALNFEQTYICPICVRQFSEADLNQNSNNPLTLEDVPPKSLGGKANILTCKECNNKCGHKIDFHLTERFKELDSTRFLPKSELDATFEKNGKTVKGKIRVEEDGRILAIHSKKNNHPTKLSEFIDSIIPTQILNIVFKKSRVDPLKFQIALLKIGYLLTFSKYGYSFLLHSSYDRIREQLLDPVSTIYPLDFWFQPSFPKEVHGVPFIMERGIESILPIFSLITSSIDRPFATIIPLSVKSIEDTMHEIKNKFDEENGEFTMTMDPMNSGVNYLTNQDAILKMLSWINKFQ